jgi:hypothetical protein
LLEYNNFNFGNKEKINFKIQVVYEAGPNSRFKKLAPRLQIGKLIFISGFFDLDDNEFPFIEAKEMDLLDDFGNNLSQNKSTTNFQSPLSLAYKFKNNRNKVQSSAKKTNASSSKITEIIDDKINEQVQDDNTSKNEETTISSTSTPNEKQKKSNKRKKELADLSIQRLERATKNPKVKTRLQKQKEEELDEDNIESEDV